MILPIETYTFALTRLRYLSAAVTGIVSTPPFRPDGKNALYCTDQVALAQQAYGALLIKFDEANTTHGRMTTAFDVAYAAAVSVYACMKSLYRSDLSVTKSILTLPKADYAAEKTLARMKALNTKWARLPNVPGTAGPMVVGSISCGSFGSMTSDFDARISAAKLADGDYSGELATFHDKLEEWNAFVSAGIAQGQALYVEGTAGRAFIDRIPVAPATQPPEEAVITLAESPAAGEVRLKGEAEHATSFQVWQKGPGEPAFRKVADVLRPGDYAATGLPAGVHEYQFVGENSRGEGPASATVPVTVAAAQAA